MAASSSYLDLLFQAGGNRRHAGEATALEAAATKDPQTGAEPDGNNGGTIEGDFTREAGDAPFSPATAGLRSFANLGAPAVGAATSGAAAVGPSADGAPLPDAIAPVVLSGADPLSLAAATWNTPKLAEGSKAICDCRICRQGLLPGNQARPLEGKTTTGAAAAVTSASAGPLGSSVDLGRTFFLHSNPTATKTICLDFNGHTTTGTAWNSSFGLAAINSSAYDFDGNVNVFSNAELERIQFIWQRVAEDFSPFGINVTTQDPSADATPSASCTMAAAPAPISTAKAAEPPAGQRSWDRAITSP